MISSKESTRELLGLDKVNQVDHVAIAVASPEATAYFVAYGDDRAPAAREIDQFLAAASRGRRQSRRRASPTTRAGTPVTIA